MKYINTLSVLALASTSLAQTFSDCDPTKKTGCPSKPGMGAAYSADFTQGASAASDWTTTSGSIGFVSEGAEFTIKALGDGPTIQSNNYLFFGYVEVVMKAAPGAGIVSSFVLESDDLDEIDWEWIGSDTARAQSNYFGKGNTTTYDRGQFHPVTTPEATFHTYAVNWTKETTTWFIDGAAVRTLNFADAVGGQNYPQTPMNIRLGNWVAGDPKNAPGTIQWAGGLTDFSQGPFSMFVQSVKVINYNPGASYKYNDESGSWESIVVLSETAQVTTASSEGNSTTGPGAVPFDSSSAAASSSLPVAAASSMAAQASVISINVGSQGQAAATKSGKKPCSTVTESGAAATAAAATAAKASIVTIDVGSNSNNTGNMAAATAASVASGSKPSVVSINVGGPGAAAATAMASSNSNSNSTSGGNDGFILQGAPSGSALAAVTIRPGGAGSNGTAAAATAVPTVLTTAPAAASVSGGTSFAIGTSSTTSATAQQQTTNAGARLQVGGAAVAALAGLLAAW